MKIVDLKCAVIGSNPIVRIVTDEGISGYGEVEIVQALPQAVTSCPQAGAARRGPDRTSSG